ncbi:phage tail protein [Chitinibacteraceae bacterium HSL-7]
MAGELFYHAGDTPPDGALVCNGALISRTAYAALFAAIGTKYGAGDGTSTFALPDLRGEFMRGADMGRGVDTGRAVGTTQRGSFVVGEVGGSTSVLALKMDGMKGANVFFDASAETGTLQTNSAVGQSVGVAANSVYAGVTRPRNVSGLACISYRT